MIFFLRNVNVLMRLKEFCKMKKKKVSVKSEFKMRQTEKKKKKLGNGRIGERNERMMLYIFK